MYYTNKIQLYHIYIKISTVKKFLFVLHTHYKSLFNKYLHQLLMKKIICSVLLVSHFCINAQTKNHLDGALADTTQLEETVLHAFRARQSTPVSFKNISKSEIDKRNTGQEPSILLSFTPSVNSYSDAGNYQGYSYFRIRGIDQTRINMTLDGIPLNEPEDQGVYFSNYPDFFNSVEDIQIQRGVGTSSNGVASYGGSINFQSPELRTNKKAEVGINYGSFNTRRIYGEYNSGLKKDKAFYIRVTNQQSDGYKYRSSNLSNSAFFSAGLFKEKQFLKFTGFIGNQRNQLAWLGVPKDIIRQDPRTNGNAKEDDSFTQSLTSLQHSYTIHPNFILNTTAYYNYLEGNYDFDLNNFIGVPSVGEVYNYDFKHHFTGIFSNVNWYTEKFKLNTGIHLNSFVRRHLGSERSFGKLYENKGFKNEFSSFVKVDYNIHKKLSLFADLQYRYSSFAYEGSVDFEKMNWNFFNTRIGINYTHTQHTNFYYSIGKTGREPTRNDLFNGEDDLLADNMGKPLFNDIPVEEVINHELGIKTHHQKWYLYANLYFMDFKNEIVFNGQFGPNGLPLNSSTAESFRSGIELDLQIELCKSIYYQNNSSYSYNRITDNSIETQPINTPNFISNHSITYQKKTFLIGINYRYQEGSYIDFANQNTNPSYTKIDLFGSYTYKSVTLKSTINNISNQEIINHGYIGFDGVARYFVQATINYSIGLIWNF